MLGIDLSTLSGLYMLTAAAVCPQQQAVKVEVDFNTVEAPYIQNLTSAQMTQQFANDPDSTLSTEKGWAMVGMLRSQYGYQSGALFNFVQQRDGTACFVFDTVKLNITYKPQIYIASDYSQHGCKHAITLMHEKRHQKTDIRIITDYLPELRRKVEKVAEAMKPRGPMPAGQIETAKAAAHAELMQSLNPIFEELNQRRRKEQAAIDTEANYRLETARCPEFAK